MFPVASRSKTIAGFHKALTGQSGKLFQSVKIFKSGCESPEPTLFKKSLYGKFQPGLVTDILIIFASFLSICGQLVFILVFVDNPVYFRILNFVYHLNPIPYS